MTGSVIAAVDWHASLYAQAGVDTPPARLRTRPVAAFHETPSEIVQPALREDVLCLHRGGPKRVQRLRDGRRTVHDVGPNSLTLLQRGREARWITEGPIDYIHLPIDARLFDELAREARGLSGAALDFEDVVGFAQPLLAGLMEELLRVALSGGESRLHQETLIQAILLTLINHAAGRSFDEAAPSPYRGGLTGRQLRLVLDHMRDNMADEINYAGLISAAGVSRAHFFRGFRQSTGTTPGRYLERLRVDHARVRVQGGDGLEQAAKAAGFTSAAGMTRAFRRTIGVTPDVYRRCAT